MNSQQVPSCGGEGLGEEAKHGSFYSVMKMENPE